MKINGVYSKLKKKIRCYTHRMFKKIEKNMSTIRQDMEHIHGMSRDEIYRF